MDFAKSAVLTFTSNLLSFVLTIMTAAIISRALGTVGKGIVDVATNFSAFAILVLGLGLASANVFYLGKRREALNFIIGNNLFILLLSSVLLLPFYFLNTYYHFQFLRGVSDFQLLLVLASVPLLNFKSAMVNILLGLQDVATYNRINVTDKLLNLLLLLVMLWFEQTATAALLAALLGSLLVGLWQVYILRHKLGSKPKLDLNLMREMFGYGFKAQVSNILQKLNYRIDVFILNYFLPLGQVGIYGIAVVLGETLWGVSGSIATVIFPVVSAAKNEEEIHKFTNQVTRITFALVLVFSLILGGLSRFLIEVLFGPSFAAAAAALLLLLPGIGIFSVSNILANYLAGTGLIAKNIYSSVISGVVTIIGNLLLIPRLGINGASIATTLSYITFTFTALLFYRKATGSGWAEILVLKPGDLKLIIDVIRHRISRL